MYLKNPFPQEVKLLYLYEYECKLCGSNRSLEIHHIMGRISDSVFNSFLVCYDCHSQMCHNQQEERRLFAITFKWVYNLGYKPNENDIEFVTKNYFRLFTPDLEQWIKNL